MAALLRHHLQQQQPASGSSKQEEEAPHGPVRREAERRRYLEAAVQELDHLASQLDQHRRRRSKGHHEDGKEELALATPMLLPQVRQGKGGRSSRPGG